MNALFESKCHTYTHAHAHTQASLYNAKSCKVDQVVQMNGTETHGFVFFLRFSYFIWISLYSSLYLCVSLSLCVCRVCLISIDTFVVISRTEEWMLNKAAFVYFPMNYVKKMESIKSSFDFIDLSCSVRFQFMVADPWWSMAIVSLVSAFELDCLVLVWFWAFGEYMTRVRQFENFK